MQFIIVLVGDLQSVLNSRVFVGARATAIQFIIVLVGDLQVFFNNGVSVTASCPQGWS